MTTTRMTKPSRGTVAAVDDAVRRWWSHSGSTHDAGGARHGGRWLTICAGTSGASGASVAPVASKHRLGIPDPHPTCRP